MSNVVEFKKPNNDVNGIAGMFRDKLLHIVSTTDHVDPEMFTLQSESLKTQVSVFKEEMDFDDIKQLDGYDAVASELQVAVLLPMFITHANNNGADPQSTINNTFTAFTIVSELNDVIRRGNLPDRKTVMLPWPDRFDVYFETDDKKVACLRFYLDVEIMETEDEFTERALSDMQENVSEEEMKEIMQQLNEEDKS